MKTLNATDERTLPINMGDRKVFTDMYNLYFGPMCYFALRFLGNKSNAEDVVEEFFTTLWQRSVRFNDEEHFKAYLYQAIHNASLKQLRNQSHAQERQYQFIKDRPDTEDGYIYNLIRAEIYGDIYRAILSLPKQCSQVIQLAYFDGMNNEKIAETMELSLQTVKNYKLRALKILKGKLSNETFQLMLLLPYIHLLHLLPINWLS